jgi:hypothetical protein
MMTTSKDIEGILLVDEMTSADVKHIRTVEQPKETPVDSDSGKSMDIVDFKLDLVCFRVTNFHTEIKRFCTNGHF